MNTHFRLILLGLWLLSGQTFAAQKVALVIGNSEYNTVSDRLKNPANDAKAVASRLKGLGYDTELILNANLSKMLTALNGLNGKVDAGGTVIVYYAGHGIQLSGHNYLVPVDAGMSNRDMVTRETIQLQEVIDKLESSGAANRLVILDACRNDPFPKAFRSGTRGLTREQLTIGNGLMVMYAASPSEVAADGQGQHGTFTQALLQGFNQSGVKLPEMMDDIREQVRRDTKGTQNPYYEGTGLSRFVLVPAAPVVNTVTPISDSDKQFWDEIKNSTDASEYQAYLTQYPNGKFAALAQSRKDKYAVKPAQPSTSKLDTLRLEREQAPNSTSIYDSLTLKPKPEQQLAQVQVRDKPQASQSNSDEELMKKGVWRDPKTNLVWMRCSLGQVWDGKTCTGEAKQYAWREALEATEAFNSSGGFGGYTDWQVPHIEDLSTIRHCSTGFERKEEIPAKAGGVQIIDVGCKGLLYKVPTINKVLFPKTPDVWYWTSSPVGFIGDAWIVSFFNGFVHKGNLRYQPNSVRLVRSIQKNGNNSTSNSDDEFMKKGMWRDPNTNLMWMRCPQGYKWFISVERCLYNLNEKSSMSLGEGLDKVKSVNNNGFGGYNDWRIPHISELVTLLKCPNGYKENIQIPIITGGDKMIGGKCLGDVNRTYSQEVFPVDLLSVHALPFLMYEGWKVDFFKGAIEKDAFVNGHILFVRNGAR